MTLNVVCFEEISMGSHEEFVFFSVGMEYSVNVC
jgi:hypothetical protein